MNKNIGIISDNPLFMNLSTALLNKYKKNTEIHIMNSYSKIEDYVNANDYNLFLIDGGITSISSMEAIQLLRLKKLNKSPIWFFPDILSESYIRRTYTIGVNRIIKKPFDPYKLSEEIINELNK